MGGLRARLIRFEERQAERAGGWPPAEWSPGEAAAMEAAIRKGSAECGLDPALGRAEMAATWAAFRRRGAASLADMVRLIAQDEGRSLEEVLADGERWWTDGGDGH